MKLADRTSSETMSYNNQDTQVSSSNAYGSTHQESITNLRKYLISRLKQEDEESMMLLDS